MNEALKKFTSDLAKELQVKFESAEVREFVATVKASGDDRTFEVVMSTSDEDRQGDELDQSGWDFKYFDMNPVVLFAHNYASFPIGIITDIEIRGDKAIATGKFAPAGINPDADMACALYQQKILKAVSPGYIQNDDGTRELLEVSFCPVPAGRYALSMRQVSALGVSTRDLVTKGFFYVKKEAKAQQVGDPCEQDDGTPGVLAEGNEAGVLVCVPSEQKEQKPNDKKQMKDKLTKAIAEEHARHGEEFAKAIDEFGEKCMKAEKAAGKTEFEKAIDTFTKAIDGEQGTHLEKCDKAIDDNYELQDQKKSIDEFKSEMTAEHLKHVKCVDKAIDEFKGEFPDAGENDGKQKSIDTFTKSVGSELERHKDAHMELCKAEMGEGETDEAKAARLAKTKGAVADNLEQGAEYRAKNDRMNYIQTIVYAFCNAYYDAPLESFKELISEVIGIIQAYAADAASEDPEPDQKALQGLVSASMKKVEKSGRTISGATADRIKAIMKALEDHNAEHEKSTTDAIASLKDLIGPPQEGEGKETKRAAAPAIVPEAKVEHLGSMAELDTYLFTQRLVRQVKTASEGALRQINEKIRETRSGGR